MRRIFGLFTFLVVIGCGRESMNSVSETQDSGLATFFVPQKNLVQVANAVKILSQHDSGFLVQAPASFETDLRAISPQSFRYDQWKSEFSKYSFSSMEQKLKQLAQDFPNLVKLDTYATSSEGRPQYVLTLEDKSNPEPKPELMITGATHGNETATVDVVLGLAELLAKGFASDDRIAMMLRMHRVHMIPAVCVDSYVAQTREAEGVDPNRDFPYPGQPNRRPVKCTADIMGFADSHNIDGTLDFHSAASMVFFPWAYTYDRIPAPDYQKLDRLTTRMAEQNGFEHGQIAQTIYVAPGSSADYYYWKHKAAATAIELSHNLAASVSDADDLVEEVTEATWRFIEEAR